jgi:CheY-like chemotaxis protein
MLGCGEMAISMHRKRLLIVDDEPRFATFVERVAEPLGYEVEVTNHGRDFQAAYRRKRPDVVVIDMVMPDIDGNELVLWLVEQRCGRHHHYRLSSGLRGERAPSRGIQGTAIGCDAE